MKIDDTTCPACGVPVVTMNDQATQVLEELVELKRMKDAGTAEPADYRHRKVIAWRNAFRLFGIHEEPKP